MVKLARTVALAAVGALVATASIGGREVETRVEAASPAIGCG